MAEFTATRRVLATLLIAVGVLAGCTVGHIPTEEAPMMVLNPGEGSLLETGTRLRVIVFNENNLSGEFVVDTVGNVSMPLIGAIPAAGVTAKTLSVRIEEVLRRDGFMREPRVAVEIMSFRPFYVLGEVKFPGEFGYSNGMTALSAVARAGGYDYRARQGVMVLTRMVDGVRKEFLAAEQTPLLPGDIIKVLERRF